MSLSVICLFYCVDAYRTLHLLLDEYVNYVMEELHTRIIERQYNNVLKVHGGRSINASK